MPPQNSKSNHYQESPSRHHSTLALFSLGEHYISDRDISQEIGHSLTLACTTTTTNIFGWMVGKINTVSTLINNCDQPFQKGRYLTRVSCLLSPYCSLLNHILFHVLTGTYHSCKYVMSCLGHYLTR